jgi:hypothetical protein
MADEPLSRLSYFDEDCGDCGRLTVELPPALPAVGDDFDWDLRDYDAFRLFMLEELAARFPERRNWTPADMEVVLVETLSVVLDQLADMHDRIQAETFLETARRPDTVRRLLSLIGYDPVIHAGEDVTNIDELEQLWHYYPHLMEEAKREGPRSIKQQHRIVSRDDYRSQLLDHPLVLDVDAHVKWTGSWYTHFVIVRLINNLQLDNKLTKLTIAGDAEDVDEEFTRFNTSLRDYYETQQIAEVPDVIDRSSRYLLRDIIDRQRMAGQEVVLQDAQLVGIILAVSVRISGDYYHSEIQFAVHDAIAGQDDGFFAPGYLLFGEDVVASDIIEVLMALDGVESVCINRLKRVGTIFADESGSGRIRLEGHEVAVLEDDPAVPKHGYLRIKLHGGKPG